MTLDIAYGINLANEANSNGLTKDSLPFTDIDSITHCNMQMNKMKPSPAGCANTTSEVSVTIHNDIFSPCPKYAFPLAETICHR
jgi:hypothetical protein